MSNYANLLADLDDFYRDSNGVAAPSPNTHQAQARQASEPRAQAQPLFHTTGDPFGFNSTAQSQQEAPATTSGNVTDDDDDWGGFETAEVSVPQDPPAPSAYNMAPMTSPVPAVSDPFKGLTMARPSPTPAATTQPDSPTRPQDSDGLPSSARTRPARASTIELMTSNLLDLDVSPEPSFGPSWSKQEEPPSRPSQKPPQRDPNILFDADDVQDFTEDEGDDEFGDFESVGPSGGTAAGKLAQSNKPRSPPASVDLLSMDAPLPIQEQSTHSVSKGHGTLLPESLTTPADSYPSPLPSPAFHQRNPFPGLAVSTSHKEDVKRAEDPTNDSPITLWPDVGSARSPTKEEWPPFEDFTSEKTPQAAPVSKALPTKEPDNWNWDTPDFSDATSQPLPPLKSQDDYDDKEPPPTNVPPPSVLMSILPELFTMANSSLFKATAGQSTAAKKKLMADPATVSFLRAYLLIVTVAGRILAGRKLRWNRDKFLAQGMAISAAGSKGMKLAGVDRAQAAREDREAADVVAAWREQVGRVRSAVASANAAHSESTRGGPALRVPEMSESMHVSTAKVAPAAPRQCVVCGLKRNERVGKVDYEVEDSFGEWWVEHWGHRACRNFWKEHEKALRQR